ncbi:glycosyltransferase family 4 protein [Neobacillus sp. SAB-20_R2A]|uniref:glycosyltransferase family 4 protein n=1 Tax=Neobacillus sp. SAB-20_R2A TaxID=3120519 RepID=UPI003C6E885E
MSMKLKIAIITPGSFPIPSPRSSSVETVVDRLTDTLQHELSFTIFGKKTQELPITEKRGKITYYRFRKRKSYLDKVLLKLADVNPDIIQIENRPKFVPMVRKKFKKTAIWLSLHSTRYITLPRINRDEAGKCLEQADKIIVPSHFLKEYIITIFGCKSEKVVVNHLGVDIRQFQSKWSQQVNQINESIKFKYQLTDKKVLLFVGRLKRTKGVHKLIKALPAIIEKRPDTVLIIAGSSSYGSDKQTKYVQNLYALAKGLTDNILFVPFIPHTQIHKWFAAADIVLVPSTGNEAFGLVNLEAMASGVPVIAAKNGGIPEVIQHGKTGYLLNAKRMEYELKEYVLHLLDQPQLLKELGENSVETVRQLFTWEKSAERYLQLCKSEINNKGV